MTYKTIFFSFIILAIGFISCDKDDDTTDTSSPYLISESLFNQTSLVSFEKIDGTLEDGTEAECFKITFKSNPVENGPYCPKTINDIGGLGVYDGNTNPGFQVMKATLFNAMEADGYDIVDDNGNIRINDFSSTPEVGFAYCLDAAPNNDLQLTFTIPAIPKLATSNDVIETVELIGLSIDGVPINGDPPSVVSGPPGMSGPGAMLQGGNIPSIDPCGGHHDPSGYYHWHFVAEVMNKVLTNNNISEVECTKISQISGTKLIGFAKDGFPIYAYENPPNDLDDCGGRNASTTEFPDGVYHYVASITDAPNVPKCLKGVAARNNFSYQ